MDVAIAAPFRIVLGGRTCAVCDTPLTVDQARAGVVCGNPACAWQHRSSPANHRCVVCQHLLRLEQRARRICSSRSCEQEWLVNRPLAARRAQEAAYLADTIAWRDSFSATEAHADAASYPVTIIPRDRDVSAPLLLERRDTLREHVTKVATLALDHLRGIVVEDDAKPVLRSLLPSPSPDVGAFLLGACSACRGACCKSGAEHAYLTKHTILTYLAEHPNSAVEEIAEAYLAALAPETMSSGCIYQSAEGCSLPRRMRSVTCNQYYCEPLYDLRVQRREDEPLRAFFATDAYDGEQTGVFATAQRAIHVHRTLVNAEGPDAMSSRSAGPASDPPSPPDAREETLR